MSGASSRVLSSNTVNLLATRCHLALRALSTSRGDAGMAATLLEVTIVTGLLAEQGHGKVARPSARAAEKAIQGVVQKGLKSGMWSFEKNDADAISTILGLFERQLSSATAAEVEEAFAAAKTMYSQ
jgi:hypothetical protein